MADTAINIIIILSEVLTSLKRIRFEEGQSYLYFTSNQGYHGKNDNSFGGNNFWNIRKVVKGK
jgi:hypothetical protein